MGDPRRVPAKCAIRGSLPAVAGGLAAALSLGGAPATALAPTAAPLPSIDARTLRPSTDSEATLVLEPPSSPGPWQWNVGAWLSYAQSPVVLRDASTGQVALRPVLHGLGCDLVAGLGLGERAAIGIDVPVLLWQDGTSGMPSTL